MDKLHLLKRLAELETEFIRYHPNGDITVYRNLPLGLGYINIYLQQDLYWFVDINWRVMSTVRMPDAEIFKPDSNLTDSKISV